MARSEQSWLAGMNPEQCEVIAHDDGPAVVLAGAGVGKTETLARRIARLIGNGHSPARIAAITFGARAARELAERLERHGASGAEASTWHSLALRILREDRTDYAAWTIDEKDTHRSLVKEAMGYKHVNWPAGDLGEVLRFLGTCKAHLANPASTRAAELAQARFAGDADRALATYAVTERLVGERRLLTFDDMLYRTWQHLQDEANRRRWGARWRYLLQDEAQDASFAQVMLAELLARDHRNYMLIGDPAQSLYGFRGSSPDYLTDFAATWDARIYCMNRNYRSGRLVVGVANSVLRLATVRLPVDLVAERPIEGSVRVLCAATPEDEGRELAQHVAAHVAGGGAYADVAVLYRTNAQSRAVEEALLARRIPHKVLGGLVFYERREVKDLLAYLRVAAKRDPGGEALRRCLNAPFRYLGVRFLERAQSTPGDTWTERVRAAGEHAGLQWRQKQSVAEWVELIERLTRAIGRGADPSALLEDVLRTTRFVEWVERDQGTESVEGSPAANLGELVRLAARFTSTGELLDFVDDAIRAAKGQQDGAADRVLLMSVHRAKGLEWPLVWVVGCNEELFPHSKGDPEEERRIFYVATTRARDELVLSHVAELPSRRGRDLAHPSRYLGDAGLLPEPEAPLLVRRTDPGGTGAAGGPPT
jgi:DNA helicase-2/ATP-dependent DNA helicase PcrA